MNRGFVSLLALGLFSIGFSSDGLGEAFKPLPFTVDYAKVAEQTTHGTFGGYIQEQYFATNQGGTNSGLFRNRRTRLTYDYLGDAKTQGRVSIEFASGTNQNTSQIQSAYIRYRPNNLKADSGPTFSIGQQPMPLGWEIPFSTPGLTWLERSIYEQTLFSAENSKGFLYQNGDAGNYWFVGLFDPLTVNDPEQNTVTTKGEVGPVYGVHGKRGNWEAGISGMTGHRPAYSSGAVSLGQTDRNFVYGDIRYHPQGSRLDVRGEYMDGKDRIPLAAVATANKTKGGNINADYMLNATDMAVLRYEFYDRNTSLDGDYQTLYGIAFLKEVSESLRLTIGTDINHNGSLATGKNYQTFTFRVLFKF